MNLDELAQTFRSIPNEKLLKDLAQYIEAWKADDRTASELETMVERFFGNSWLSSDENHSKAYGLWEAFRNEAIRGIGGMTMNERLYLFSLFERYDACSTEEERLVVYSKLHAKP
tara:strand:+ start:655 stop:999 length:345 start_codon:yes stop_codon:yes gene_type:complete